MTTARVVVAPAYGGPDQLEVRDVEVPHPGPGEVTIEVRAAGVNPVDYKLFSGARGADPDALPLPVGLEVAGVLAAIGPGAEIASGGGAVGDEVVAFRVSGGYGSALTVPAADVFAKPARGLRSLRVGAYRILYQVTEEGKTVRVAAIRHRSVSYGSDPR
jgi:NADPH:quinone reductase-like Zn-dependent oxidoreductase